MTPTFATDKRCSGYTPGSVSERMAGVEPLVERAALTRGANELTVKRVCTFLFGGEDTLMPLYRCQGVFRVHLYVWHAQEGSTSVGTSQ